MSKLTIGALVQIASFSAQMARTSDSNKRAKQHAEIVVRLYDVEKAFAQTALLSERCSAQAAQLKKIQALGIEIFADDPEGVLTFDPKLGSFDEELLHVPGEGESPQ